MGGGHDPKPQGQERQSGAHCLRKRAEFVTGVASAPSRRRAFLPQGLLHEREEAVYNYVKAVGKGLNKVMSKMGISTYMSYCGAQIFEAIGLSRAMVDKYFTGTATNIEGIGVFEVAEEAIRLHQTAFSDDPVMAHTLDAGGEYAYRIRGEEHMWTPDTIAKLQHSIKSGNSLPIRNIPVGTTICCVEMLPGKGAQLARSAGTSAQLLAREGIYALLRFRPASIRENLARWTHLDRLRGVDGRAAEDAEGRHAPVREARELVVARAREARRQGHLTQAALVVARRKRHQAAPGGVQRGQAFQHTSHGAQLVGGCARGIGRCVPHHAQHLTSAQGHTHQCAGS